MSQQRRDSELTVEELRDCNMPTTDVGMSLGGDEWCVQALSRTQ